MLAADQLNCAWRLSPLHVPCPAHLHPQAEEDVSVSSPLAGPLCEIIDTLLADGSPLRCAPLLPLSPCCGCCSAHQQLPDLALPLMSGNATYCPRAVLCKDLCGIESAGLRCVRCAGGMAR